MTIDRPLAALELWGGPEYTLNRVGDVLHDQTERSGHGDRATDIDRFADLGLAAVRYPVLWERVAPDSLDAPDWAWTDDRLARIRAAGMRPIAGLLHHGGRCRRRIRGERVDRALLHRLTPSPSITADPSAMHFP